MKERTERLQSPYMAVAGVVGWSALAVQLYLFVAESVADGTGAVAGVFRYCRYFTILTNTLVAISFTYPLVSGNSRGGRFFSRPDVTAAITVYIIVTGAVYDLLLRSLWHPAGLQLVVTELLHDVIPVVYVLYWLVFVPKGGLRWGHALVWLCYPSGYLLYVLSTGAVSGVYPYPFLDVHQLGYAGVLMNGVGLGGVFVTLGLLCIVVDRVMSPGTTPGKARSVMDAPGYPNA